MLNDIFFGSAMPKKKAKIAIVINEVYGTLLFRKPILLELIKREYDVYVIAPPDRYVAVLKKLGIKYIPVDMTRFMSLLKDFFLLFHLYKIFKREAFDIVHTYTSKPIIYAPPMAKLAGTKKIIASITGLGYVFIDNQPFKMRVLRYIVKTLYKFSFIFCDKVSFQNPDDLELFVKEKLVRKEKGVLILGSGVNLAEFSISAMEEATLVKLRRELGLNSSNRVVMMVARATLSKGVKEFIEASRLVAEKYPKVKFLLVGWAEDGSPDSVSRDYLIENKSENFNWLGFRENVRDFIAIADIVVYPSYYREGVPKATLEALSMGKPVVTTNNVGCKEVVDDGINGYLIPIKDSKALTNAILGILSNEDKLLRFGKNSRLKAEREFDEKIVVQKTVDLYQNH